MILRQGGGPSRKDVCGGTPKISELMIGFEQKSGSPVITIGLAIVDGRITHL